MAAAQTALSQIEGVTEVRRIRLRRTGNKVFSDIVVAAPRIFTFEQTHSLTERIEQVILDQVLALIPQAEVDSVVHIEPTATNQETVTDQIHHLAKSKAYMHMIFTYVMLVDAWRLILTWRCSPTWTCRRHIMSPRAWNRPSLQSNRSAPSCYNTLEAPTASVVRRQDVTRQFPEMTARIKRIADKIAGSGSAHDIHIYRPSTARSGNLNGSSEKSDQLDLVLHTFFDAHIPLSQAHIQAEEIKRALRQAYPQLGSVVIYTEPPEQ